MSFWNNKPKKAGTVAITFLENEVRGDCPACGGKATGVGLCYVPAETLEPLCSSCGRKHQPGDRIGDKPEHETTSSSVYGKPDAKL